jgi:uroporphyrinogen-III synthase
MRQSPPTVALPETRQLDVLAQLLERRDMRVIRCPMVAINDAPDADPIVEWIERLIRTPMDLFVIYTGEGVERLRGFAERAGHEAEFVTALANTPLLTRGPKPKRSLRKLEIKPQFEAMSPTTEGVIETLGGIELAGRRVGVQLYGTDPNEKLLTYLRSRDAEPDCVAPYVYASASDDDEVQSLIEQMRDGDIDAIAFTSKSQVQRLRKVAAKRGLSGDLKRALGSLDVAAIGPVVARELQDWGIAVDVMPEHDFFMKPLVTRLVSRLTAP